MTTDPNYPDCNGEQCVDCQDDPSCHLDTSQQEPTGAERFFAFARARHQITLDRRAGLPRPWTDDPILSTYRFTNVFREMDRVTVWIEANVRGRLAGMEPWRQVLAMVLARTFNRTETLEQIFCQERLMGKPIAWTFLESADRDIKDVDITTLEHYMRRHCPKPWVTGAYIVKTPDGMDKLAGALWIVEQARQQLRTLSADRSFACSMQALHADLVRMPYLGGFTAYEIVTDVRWTEVGRDWPDIMSWAHAGPGAIRGLHRIHGREWETGETNTRGDRVVKFPPLSEAQALAEMRDLLRESLGPMSWPYWTEEGNLLAHEPTHDWSSQMRDRDAWPRWEMREVEHTLCEFDKYERVRNGQGKPRGVYR